VSHLDSNVIYPRVGGLMSESAWAEDLRTNELADVLRSTMREEYADASDEEMEGALGNVLEAMSPAEAFSFGSVLNQIGKSAGRLASDPAFIQVVRTAAPIAGGALGTLVGGPVGTALGSQLGNLAAKALPAGAAPPPVAAAPVVAAPAPTAAAASPAVIPAPAAGQPVVTAPVPGAAPVPPSDVPPAPGPASSVAGGSAAAAQAVVLSHHPDLLSGLVATALGQHGRKEVSGIPVAQLLALLSHVVGQAAADADELMYLEQHADLTESFVEDAPAGSVRSLYSDLLGADNLELAEAAAWDGLD
jgi:hypothetical protein